MGLRSSKCRFDSCREEISAANFIERSQRFGSVQKSIPGERNCKFRVSSNRESWRVPSVLDWVSRSLPSLLFLGFGKLQGDLSDQMHELGVLPLQLDDFRQRRLPLGLLGDPCVYGVLGNAVVFGGLNDGDAVIFNATDNLLLDFRSRAMFFYIPVY